MRLDSVLQQDPTVATRLFFLPNIGPGIRLPRSVERAGCSHAAAAFIRRTTSGVIEVRNCFRWLEKCPVLLGFLHVAINWRRGRDSHPRFVDLPSIGNHLPTP